MSVDPFVSIGLPVKNGANFLEEALESLLSQSHRNFELIISDNCSTDRTAEICARAAEQDQRIRLFHQTTPRNAVGNFNFVLEQARGEFFMWAAHDDKWDKTFLEKMLNLLLHQEDAVVAFCEAVVFGDRSGLCNRYFSIASPAPAKRLLGYIMQNERYGKSNMNYGLFRTSVLQQVGGIRPDRPELWGQDHLFLVQVLLRGNAVFLSEPLFYNRYLDSGTTGSAPQAGRLSFLRILPSLLARKLDYIGLVSGFIREASQITTPQKVCLHGALLCKVVFFFYQSILWDLFLRSLARRWIPSVRAEPWL